jgi:hypothetical protein
VKRRQVIERVRREAKRQGLEFSVVELTNHTALVVGGFRSTIGRHSEIPDGRAQAFWRQFEPVFGKKGWWR